MFALQPDTRLGRQEIEFIQDLRQLSDHDYDALIEWVKTGRKPSFTAVIFSLLYKHVAKFTEPTLSQQFK